MSPTGEAAREYAAMGWPVLPLHWCINGVCQCRYREKCEYPGKHPLINGGVNNSSVDFKDLEAWFNRWPSANVGIATGHAFDALDLDHASAGEDLARRAQEAGELTPECWGWGPMVITAKGHHLYYATISAGSPIGFIPHADWRGLGTYVVAPPSFHHSGHQYRWHEDCPPSAPLVAPPAFLVDLVRRKEERGSGRLPAASDGASVRRWDVPWYLGGTWSPGGLIGHVQNAPVGERNKRLNWAGYQLRTAQTSGLISASQAKQVKAELLSAAVAVGLKENPSRATIKSATGEEF